MSEEEAIERLKERVKLDRKIRDNKTESDYEQFCENECQAIETILNLADKQQKLINQLLEDMKERANNFSYESEIMWRKIEKAEKLLEEQ